MIKQNDRDMLFILMVMYNRMTGWLKDDCGLELKDKNKVKAAANLIMDLFVQYRKREGDVAFTSLCKESENFNIVVLSKDEQITNTIDSFEANLVKPSVQNIMKQCCDCTCCDKCDYKKCDWFNLHKFVGTEPKHNGKNKCPYRVEMDDIFNAEL